MKPGAHAAKLGHLGDAVGDAIREKAWDLAEFLMDAVPLSHPDWGAIELRAGELAELAGTHSAS